MEIVDGARRVSDVEMVKLTRERAEQFLYREAQLADEHRFDEWFALWDTDSITYWVPSNRDDIDPRKHVSIVYENREQLEERLTRLKSRGVHSQQPRSRMRRIISNVIVEPDDGSFSQVEANFMLLELRSGIQNQYGGRFIYRLRHDATSIHIVSKKVLLVNNDEFLGNLTFLL
jgi:3-phenylpropionate/cinnamic acid dioxygenase small subunit